MKNLTSINLSESELNLIPPKLFSGLVNLEKIYISQNNLQTLPSGLFDELHSLQYLWLSGNPWNCSCELIWLLDVPQITDEVVCESAERSLALYDVAELLNCSSTLPTVVTSTWPSTTEKQGKMTDFWQQLTNVTSPGSTDTVAKAVTSTETIRSRNINDLRNIVLASTVGALTFLLIVAVLIIRCACQNKCGERLNRVNNDEEGRPGSDSDK